MSFKAGILPLIKPNSILGIEFLCKLTQTRYQVSSSSSNWPQLDTWYRVATQISLNGHQLGTWYRVDASTGLNSIPGIALRHNAAQIDTKFTSKDKASILPKHRSYDCPIDLQSYCGVRSTICHQLSLRFFEHTSRRILHMGLFDIQRLC